MLFYTFFRTQIGKQLKIQLKNDEIFTGILESIDYFLNFKLSNVSGKNEQDEMECCVIRGSSVKNVEFDASEDDLNSLHEATRFRFV